MSMGDIDGDGDLDALFANYNNKANRVYTNDGLGGFSDTGQLLGGNTSERVRMGDLDDDGDLDALFADDASTSGINAVWRNEAVCMMLVCGDCDGDGDIDILDALPISQIAAGLIMPIFLDLLVCDVDGDGDIDVIDSLLVARVAAGFPVMLNCPIP